MLKRVWIQGYRCFRDVEVELKPLQVLVGPNGSGKSAFLDAIRFVEDIVRNGLKKAVERRARRPDELSWYGKSPHIRFELNWQIPSKESMALEEAHEIKMIEIEYELELALRPSEGDLKIRSEALRVQRVEDGTKICLFNRQGNTARLEPEHFQPGHIIQLRDEDRTVLSVIISLGHMIVGSSPGLHNLAEWLPDLERWFNKSWPEFLHPQPDAIRKATSELEAESSHRFSPDAHNLALLMEHLKSKYSHAYNRWIEQICYLIGRKIDLQVRVDEVERTRRIWMRQDDLWVSAAGISDGLLRFIALTFPAYDPDSAERIFFIEEIENGLSPDAIRLIFDVLVATYDIQWLVTSHHPLLIHLAGPERLLIFSKDGEEARVIPGNQHPLMLDLRPEDNLSELFMAGILS